MEQSEITTKRKRSLPKFSKSKVLVAVVVLLSLGAAGVMTVKYNNLKNNPTQVSQKEQEKLITKVGKHLQLPTGEQPSIATVSDKEKLKAQAFFNGAENGDTLLIYTNAKKAILYREKTDQIIEVAPIAIDTTGAASGAPTTAPAGTDKKQ